MDSPKRGLDCADGWVRERGEDKKELVTSGIDDVLAGA